MNIKDPKQFNRLMKSVKESDKHLDEHRENARKAMRLFVGTDYHSQRGTNLRRPMNLIKTAWQSLVMSVSPVKPGLQCTSPTTQYKPYSLELQANIEFHVEQLKLAKTFNQSISQAMCSMGIIKSGLDREGSYEIDVDGERGRKASLFSLPVLFDDWVHDVAGRTDDEMRYWGDKYPLPLEYVKSSKLFKKTDKLVADERERQDTEGERSDTIDSGEPFVEDMIYVRELYLPKEDILIIVPLKEPQHIIRTIEWEGPDVGPYRWLGFHHCPGQVMPIPPVCDWTTIDEAVSDLQCKLLDQARREKHWQGVQAGGSSDGSRILEVNDGDVIKMMNPNAARDFQTPGPNAQTAAFVNQLLNWYNWITGNLNIQLGLGPSSGTFGQDRMLAENASRFVQDIQKSVMVFVEQVLGDIAWYLHTETFDEYQLEKEWMPGERIPFIFEPETERPGLSELRFELTPYVAHELTPAEQYQVLIELVRDILVPLGAQIDLEAVAREAARLRGFKQLETLVKFGSLPTPPGNQESRGSAVSKPRGQYVHISRPADKLPSFDQDVMPVSAGAGQQGQQPAGWPG